MSPAPLVFGGSHSLIVQSYRPRELLSGSVNADGYGVVWYRNQRPVRTRSVRPIWQDADLERLLRSVESGLSVAALRNVTPGIPSDLSGVPPLVRDRWTFVLNGALQDFRGAFMRPLHQRLPDDLYGALEGVSDTETLFALALASLRRGARPAQAIADVTGAVVELARQLDKGAQLNLVVSDGERLAASRGSTVEATNSLYRVSGAPIAPGGTVLASEPLDDDPAWEPLDAHTVVELGPSGDATVAALPR